MTCSFLYLYKYYIGGIYYAFLMVEDQIQHAKRALIKGREGTETRGLIETIRLRKGVKENVPLKDAFSEAKIIGRNSR